MEKKELVVCDTNILIEVIDRNNKKIIDRLISMGEKNLCISSITYSEIVFGATSKSHLAKLMPELNRFVLIPVNSRIDEIHRSLVFKYSLSHKLSLQDALIAATSLHFDIKIYSLNKKDFQFIEGLKLIS